MSGDFQGSIGHTNEFYAIVHGDYRRKAGCDKNETITIGILEVMHDANIRTLLRSEQRGGGARKRPRYQRIEDIPDDLVWISPSLQEMHRRSIEMLSETMIQRAIPSLERRGFIKTRFVRLDEHGTIIAVFPCTGQRWEEHSVTVARKGRDDEEQVSRRLVNCYDFGDEDPRLVVRTCLKQYRLCPDAINRALRGGGGEPPDGDDDPREDDDTPYLDDDLGAQPRETNGGGDSKFTNHHARSERQKRPPVGKNTNQDSKNTNGGIVNVPTGHSKNTNQDSKNTAIHARSNKVVITTNITSNGKKEGAFAPSLTSPPPDDDKKERIVALPPPGPISTEMVYYVLAHYLCEPRNADYDKCMAACVSLCGKLQAMQLDEYPTIHGKYAARATLIRTTLFMMLADPDCWSGPRRPWLSAWKIEQYFEEYAMKSAGWLPSPESEYATDVAAHEEAAYHAPTLVEDQQPVIYVEVEVASLPQVQAAPAAPDCQHPQPGDDQQQGASPLSDSDSDSDEERFCDECNLPRHYAKPLGRILDLGYGIVANDDGSFAILLNGEPLEGFARLEPHRLAFSVPTALMRRSQKPPNATTTSATTLIGTVA